MTKTDAISQVGRVGRVGRAGQVRQTYQTYQTYSTDPTSVSVRQTIPAVIAANGRFNQTRAVVVTAAENREPQVTWMQRRTRLGRRGTDRDAGMTGDRLPNHLAQFLIIHTD